MRLRRASSAVVLGNDAFWCGPCFGGRATRLTVAAGRSQQRDGILPCRDARHRLRAGCRCSQRRAEAELYASRATRPVPQNLSPDHLAAAAASQGSHDSARATTTMAAAARLPRARSRGPGRPRAQRVVIDAADAGSRSARPGGAGLDLERYAVATQAPSSRPASRSSCRRDGAAAFDAQAPAWGAASTGTRRPTSSARASSDRRRRQDVFTST